MRTDTERLDWLERQPDNKWFGLGVMVSGCDDGWAVFMDRFKVPSCATGPDLRSAIDSAMDAEEDAK